MRCDRHGPTTRFRRRRGRQGNRRQRLSSAVAGGTTRGREGRPLPHFPAEVGDRPTPTLAGVARGRPPLIHSPSPENPVAVRRGAAHRGSTDWPCSPGQNTTATALRAKAQQPGARLDPSHSGQDHTQPFLLLPPHPLPTLRTEAGTCHCQEPRNPLSSVLYFSRQPHSTPIRSRYTQLSQRYTIACA